MRHSEEIWQDPSYAQDPIIANPEAIWPPERPQRRQDEPPRPLPPLGGVCQEWLDWLSTRTKPVSPETLLKYRKSMLGLVRSISDAHPEPRYVPVLADLTPANVNRWLNAQRFRQLAPEGIAGRLSGVKAFTKSYLWLQGEYTTADLLAKVARAETPETAKPGLTEEERERIFAAFDGQSYEDVRNDAFVAVLLATSRRFKAVLELDDDRFDRQSGAFTATEKGGQEIPCQLSPGSLKKVRRWLRIRRQADGVRALWTTREGQPLSYWGGQSIFKRLKERSGVRRLHAHLCRHTGGQEALRSGATPGEVQGILGHKTAAMTSRYTRTVQAQVNASNMSRYAVV